MSNKNGIHHVIRNEISADDVGKWSYCGKLMYSFDMPIQLDHAKACIEQGTYLQPCKKCMKQAEREDKQ